MLNLSVVKTECDRLQCVAVTLIEYCSNPNILAKREQVSFKCGCSSNHEQEFYKFLKTNCRYVKEFFINFRFSPIQTEMRKSSFKKTDLHLPVTSSKHKSFLFVSNFFTVFFLLLKCVNALFSLRWLWRRKKQIDLTVVTVLIIYVRK